MPARRRFVLYAQDVHTFTPYKGKKETEFQRFGKKLKIYSAFRRRRRNRMLPPVLYRSGYTKGRRCRRDGVSRSQRGCCRSLEPCVLLSSINVQIRNSSATLQACAMQPRGRVGAFPS